MADAELLLMGIDEAGRGPLVGDMFVAAVVLDGDAAEHLMRAGVRDSKLLTPASRFRLFREIISRSRLVYVRRYPPEVIDSRNINNLFAEAVRSSIRVALSLGLRPLTVYVDAPSCGSGLTRALGDLAGGEVEVVAEPGADRKYVAVSAASIVAKVLRDSHIRYLQGVYGDFGSGYPSDPRTTRWLRDLVSRGGDLPPIVRRSWRTVRRLGGGGDLTRFIAKRSGAGP